MSHFYCMGRQRKSRSSENKAEVQVQCLCGEVLMTGRECAFSQSFGGEL